MVVTPDVEDQCERHAPVIYIESCFAVSADHHRRVCMYVFAVLIGIVNKSSEGSVLSTAAKTATTEAVSEN